MPSPASICSITFCDCFILSLLISFNRFLNISVKNSSLSNSILSDMLLTYYVRSARTSSMTFSSPFIFVRMSFALLTSVSDKSLIWFLTSAKSVIKFFIASCLDVLRSTINYCLICSLSRPRVAASTFRGDYSIFNK